MLNFDLARNFLVASCLICLKLAIAQSPFNHELSPNNWIEQFFKSHQTSELIPEFDDSYGVVFRDLNNDGLADLYVVRFRNLNRLFINQGASKPFEDRTIESGLGGNLMPRGKQNLELGASSADCDNNGLPDILIAGWGVASSLFYHTKALHFSYKSLNAIANTSFDANAGIWADVNRDGWLDLFLTDEHSKNHLLINDGFGRFRVSSHEFGIDSVQSTSQGAAFRDVDGDGFPDLYICNWFAPDVFMKNIRGRYFQKVQLPIPHLTDSLNSNSITFGDIDNDADPDMIVTDRQGSSRIYRNDISVGDTLWQFSDITQNLGIPNQYPAYGSIVADFNNDGWQDIFFTNIGPNMLYLNQGEGQFYLAYSEPFPFISMKKKYSTGSAVADYDNDGDLDLFVANKDTNSIFYANPINNGDFLRIQLRGVRSNRDAIGSKIWLYEQTDKDSLKLTGFQEISGGSGYLSFSEPVAHFGVNPDMLYQAVIEFPSGEKIIRENLKAGENYFIEELGGFQKALILSYRWIVFTSTTEDFWANVLLFFLMVAVVSGFIYFSILRYGWKNKQTAWFLISILVIFYILFIIQSDDKFLTIILTQLGALFILIVATAVFMEKIRRLEMKRYAARKLIQDFIQQLIFIKNNKELYDQLAKTIQKAMNAGFCLVMGIGDSSLYPTAVAGSKNEISKFSLTGELKQRLLEDSVITGEKLGEIFPGLTNTGADLAIPLSRKDKLYAVLLLGKSESEKGYLAEDVSILQILANQAAIAIENNNYIEETKQLIKKVTESEVQKKYIKELEGKNQTLKELNRTIQETQSQLIQSEKMASIGQLVAGVAHELNNPISFIYANMKELENYIIAIEEILKLLPDDLDKSDWQQNLKSKLEQLQDNYDLEYIREDIHSLINESIEGGHRVKEIVQNLRNFSRIDEGDFKSVDLHDGLNSTLLLLNNEIKNRIEVIKDYGKLPKVECHPGHINQVFMNLLLNATQAIEGEGQIRVTTRQTNEHVEIRISDSGKGIPENIKNKIFDPFFTTKPVGKGTGLGLSISYGIIKNHNGEITVESKAGEGTTFRIKLPVKAKGS